MKLAVSQVIARALQDLGVRVVTHVPGSDGTSIYNEWLRLMSRSDPFSFHEEVACAMAHGAAITGGRSAVIIKSHGLAKAGNFLVDALSAGTTAGFVMIVLHDESGQYSDNAFDAISLINGLEVPYHVGQAKTIYQDVLLCFKRSESTRLPYILYLDDALVEKKTVTGQIEVNDPGPPEYKRDITRHLVVPFFSTYQRMVLEAALEGTDETIPDPPVPDIPDGLPEDWQLVVRSYSPLFDVFRKLRGDVVTGDTGVSTLFAFPPYHCVDMTTYLGGSIPMAIGAWMAGHRKVWALTGDFSFISAGHLALIEAMQRKVPVKVIIFYNSKAATTGGQEFPGGVLEQLLKGYESHVKWIDDPNDMKRVEKVLKEADRLKGTQIIVADYRRVEN